MPRGTATTSNNPTSPDRQQRLRINTEIVCKLNQKYFNEQLKKVNKGLWYLNVNIQFLSPWFKLPVVLPITVNKTTFMTSIWRLKIVKLLNKKSTEYVIYWLHIMSFRKHHDWISASILSLRLPVWTKKQIFILFWKIFESLLTRWGAILLEQIYFL